MRRNKRKGRSLTNSPEKYHLRKSRKYHIPEGYVVNSLDELVPPQRDRPSKSKRPYRSTSVASKTSAASSIHASNLQDPDNLKVQSCKPIFAQSTCTVIRNVLLSIQLKEKPLFKRIQGNTTKVVCSNADDKLKVMEKLNSQLIGCYSFSEPQDKPLIFVLRGYPHEECDVLKSKLTEENIPVSKVSFLMDKEDASLYIVQFERGTINLNILQHQHRSVDSVIVRWEHFDRARKRLTQCHNCQRYGHSASNCRMQYRCVKCLNSHKPGECPRKSRNDEGSPMCVNCNGEHAANSRVCKFHSEYKERIERQRTSRHPPALLNPEKFTPHRPKISSKKWEPQLASAPHLTQGNFLH